MQVTYKRTFVKTFLTFFAILFLIFVQASANSTKSDCKNKVTTSLRQNFNIHRSQNETETAKNCTISTVLNKCWNIVFNPTFLTFALVLVTTIYVVTTNKILKANRQVVDLMQDQLEASLRPYVLTSTFIVAGNGMICLKISNTGKTAAQNLQLKLDRDFYQYGKKEVRYNLANAYAFQNTIETFVPGAELVFYIGMGFQIFDDNTNSKLTPTQFTITATYKYSEKTVSEKTTIDLQAYRMTSLPPQEAIVTQLKEIVKAISKHKKNT